MMQQVAASRSDIAALGKSSAHTGADAQQSESEFGPLFQQAAAVEKKPAPASAPQTGSQAARNYDTADIETETHDKSAPGRAAEPETGKSDRMTSIPVTPPTDEPDDGNLVDMKAIPNKASLEDLLNEQQGDVDWLAYVEAVRKSNGEGSVPGKADDRYETLPVMPTPTESDDAVADPLAGLLAALRGDGMSADSGPGSLVETTEITTGTITEDSGLKGDGKQEILPIMPIMTRIAELVSAQAGEASAAGADGQPQTLAALREQLMVALRQNTGTEGTAGNTSQPGPVEGDTELLAQVLQAELVQAAKDGGEKFKTLPVAPVTDQGAHPGQLAGMTPADAAKNLMQSMQAGSEVSQQQMTEALAEKVVALLPPAASDQQHQQVKQAIIGGIQEIQAQLAQGREPGIDLKALISDAIRDANIPVTPQMLSQAEQQVSQLNMMLSSAQSTAAQVVSSQLVSTDAVIQENSQVRSESTKAQAQADGLDRPVNITKAEGQQQLHEKIRWMVNARNPMAEIRLDPPELGSMQVRVNVNGDTASVNFVVQSQQAKEALADAEPRLRDMLAEQGIELGESSVREQGQDDSGAGDEADGQFAGGEPRSGDEDGQAVIEQPITRESRGGIDYYA